MSLYLMNTIYAESKFLGINGFKLIWFGLMEKFHFPCLYKVLHLFFKWPRRAISPTTTTTTKNFKLIRWDKISLSHTHKNGEKGRETLVLPSSKSLLTIGVGNFAQPLPTSPHVYFPRPIKVVEWGWDKILAPHH